MRSGASDRVLRAGVIGAGGIAWRYDGGAYEGDRSVTHASCYDRHPKTVLAAVFDPDPESRAALIARLETIGRRDVRVLETLDALLAQELDIVSICSPSARHAEQIEACLGAGVPRLWIEKPVTLALSDYLRLRAKVASMTAKPRTVVNYPRRVLSVFQDMRSALASATSSPAAAEHPPRLEVAYSRGLDVNGVHLLDLIGFVCEATEPPALDWVRPNGPNPSFGFTLGGVAVSVLGNALPYHLVDLRLTTAEGRLTVGGGGAWMSKEAAEPNPDYPGFHRLAPPAPVGDPERRAAELRDATYLSLDELVADDGRPSSTMETAFFAQALLEAVNAACADGGPSS